MSEDRFNLDLEDTKKISTWFNRNANAETKCQVCQSRSWNAIPMLFTPIIFNLGKNVHGGRVLLPTAMVECKVCGHRLSFNAEKIGIDYKKYSNNHLSDGSEPENE